jgi:hypothetical protein
MTPTAEDLIRGLDIAWAHIKHIEADYNGSGLDLALAVVGRNAIVFARISTDDGAYRRAMRIVPLTVIAEAVARKAAAHPLIAAIDAATHDCIARVAS